MVANSQDSHTDGERGSSEAPPPYQTIAESPSPRQAHLQFQATNSPSEPPSPSQEQLVLGDTESARFEETPRGRFDYHIDLRTSQQAAQWSRAKLDSTLYGDEESQEKAARSFVISEWEHYGLWDFAWLEAGPDPDEHWGCGDDDPVPIPACLLSMELAWEMENLSLMLNPVLIPCLTGPDTKPAAAATTKYTQTDKLATAALQSVFDRWATQNFSYHMGQSTLQYGRNLLELYTWLPQPARMKLRTTLSVQRWPDLLTGWAEQVGVMPPVDFLGLALPVGTRENELAAVHEAIAHENRIEAIRRVRGRRFAPAPGTRLRRGLFGCFEPADTTVDSPAAAVPPGGGLFGAAGPTRLVEAVAQVDTTTDNRAPAAPRRPGLFQSFVEEHTTTDSPAQQPNWPEIFAQADTATNSRAQRRRTGRRSARQAQRNAIRGDGEDARC